MMILAAVFPAAAVFVFKAKRTGWATSDRLLYRIDAAAMSAVLLIVAIALAVLGWVGAPPLR
jgi:hypothetical protein